MPQVRARPLGANLGDRPCNADTPVRALSRTLRYLFLKDLAGNEVKNKPEIQANSLIYKYFTSKSLFLKDLASLTR